MDAEITTYNYIQMRVEEHSVRFIVGFEIWRKFSITSPTHILVWVRQYTDRLCIQWILQCVIYKHKNHFLLSEFTTIMSTLFVTTRE